MEHWLFIAVMVFISVSRISFRARISNISLVDSPTGEKLVKVELSEDRELPGPVVMQKGGGELAREVVPIVSQILSSLPGIGGRRVRIPRLTVFFTEDEWEKILEKPNIGEYLEVVFDGKNLHIRKAGD